MTIPAYQLVNGQFVYNPNNTAGIPNDQNRPVNPEYGTNYDDTYAVPGGSTTGTNTRTGETTKINIDSSGRESSRTVTKPRTTTKTPEIAVDYETGKSYVVTDPHKPVEVEFPKEQFIEINRQRAETDAEYQRRFEAIKVMTPYASGSGQYDSLRYDIGKALRDGVSTQTLKDLGVDQKDIDQAKQMNDAPIPTSDYVARYFEDKGWEVDRSKLIRKMQNEGLSDRKIAENLKIYDKRLQEASDAYIAKYGKGDFILSGTANTLSFIVPVAKVIAPGVSWKDVTKEDIIATGVQIALVATPFVAAKALTGIKVLAWGKKAVNVTQTVKAGSQETLAIISRTDPKLFKPFQQVAKAQEKYVKSILKVRDKEYLLAEAQKDASTAPDIIQMKKWDIEAAREAQLAQQRTLEKAAKVYAEAVKKSPVQKFDSPMVKESIDRMPQEIIRHTDNVVNDILNPKSSPFGNVAKMQSELANAKTRIPQLEKEIDELLPLEGQGTRVKMLNRELQRLRQISNTYPEKIDRAIRYMDVEFGRGGQFIKSRGRVATLEKPPTRGTSLDSELARAGAKRKSTIVSAGGSRAAAALRSVTAAAAAREALSRGEEPDFIEAVGTKPLNVSKPGSKPYEFTQINKEAAPGSSSATASDTSTKTSTNTRPETRPDTGSKPGPQLKPLPKPGTKTTVKTTVTTKIPTKPVPPLKKGVDGGTDGSAEVVILKPGSLAWEQGKLKKGEVVYFVQPPYKQKQVLVGVEPQGYIDTGDTPRETIQTIGGPVKKPVHVKIGVTTAHAYPDQKEITFSRNAEIAKANLHSRVNNLLKSGARHPTPRGVIKGAKTSRGPARMIPQHPTKHGRGITRRSDR